MPRRILDTLTQPQNLRLLNLLFQRQVYLEGFQLGVATDYRKRLKELYRRFAQFFAENRYNSLDQFTKGQLEDFIRRFQREQQHFYSTYTEQLITLLKAFLTVDAKTTRIIFHNTADEGLVALPPIDELWKAILADPIAASGQFIPQQLAKIANDAAFAVTSAIRRGYALGWTNEQTLRSIVGNSEVGFKDGLFARLAVQQAAATSIVIQHLNQGATEIIGGEVGSQYQYVAILDDRTTVICRSLNGNIYEYGNGPVPPVHYFCRSFIVPVSGKKLDVPSDFAPPSNIKPLTLGEFENKMENLFD